MKSGGNQRRAGKGLNTPCPLDSRLKHAGMTPTGDQF